MIRQVVRRVALTLKRLTMVEPTASSATADLQDKGESSQDVIAGVKRAAETDEDAVMKKARSEGGADKRPQTGEQGKQRKKKMAMLLVYSGKGYQGMQLQGGGLKTIERELLDALVKAEVITEEQTTHPGPKIGFQRAARTDKGVSAAGQVVSLKMLTDVENTVGKINGNLPPQIQVLALLRGTKSFDSKNHCCGRTYMYLLPTFAFTPVEQLLTENFRATSDLVTKTNEVLTMFKGTKNFHNFTSGKKASDPSARRYITDFSMGEPFVRDDLEWAVIKVRGQSFMMHQIRKMIGITIAIVRGLTGMDAIERAWGPDKCDIPKAPGLGLMLDRVHYDRYNKRFGNDGIHEAIDWDVYKDQIDTFKEDYIYSTIIETEKEEKSMLMWMSTLHLHHFDKIRPDHLRNPMGDTGMCQARYIVEGERRQKAVEAESASSASTTATTSATNAAAPSGECETATSNATDSKNISATEATQTENTDSSANGSCLDQQDQGTNSITTTEGESQPSDSVDARSVT